MVLCQHIPRVQIVPNASDRCTVTLSALIIDFILDDRGLTSLQTAPPRTQFRWTFDCCTDAQREQCLRPGGTR